MWTRPRTLPGKVLLPCPTGPRQHSPLTPCHALKGKSDTHSPYSPTAQVQLPSLPLPLPFHLSAGFLTSNLPFLSTHRNPLSTMTFPSPALLGPAPLAGVIRGRGARGCSLQQSPGPWTHRAGRTQGQPRATPRPGQQKGQFQVVPPGAVSRFHHSQQLFSHFPQHPSSSPPFLCMSCSPASFCSCHSLSCVPPPPPGPNSCLSTDHRQPPRAARRGEPFLKAASGGG